jgi:hypothetical protein
MSYYSKQYTFNKVAKHLMGMSEQSMMDDRDSCAYRGRDGSKCAAGALIPDDLYSKAMEYSPVSHSSDTGRLIAMIGHDVALVRDLQRVHDLNRFFSDREFYLKCVAEKHGLRIPDWL